MLVERTAARRLLLTVALALVAALGTVMLGAVWAFSGAPEMPFGGIVLIALIATLLVRRIGRGL